MLRGVLLLLVAGLMLAPVQVSAQSPVSCEEEKRAFDLLIGHIRGQRNGFELDVARHLAKLERDIAVLEAKNTALTNENAKLKKAQDTPVAGAAPPVTAAPPTTKEPTNP